MTAGELLTQWTVLIALCAAGAGAALLLVAKERPHRLTAARWLWTLGCGLFMAHVICAFHFHHRWSHVAAYADTARQTAELTGRAWGGGLYLNYLFTACWVAETIWWWSDEASWKQRPRWISALWAGFFAFMVFNATIVFGGTAARVVGAATFGGLALLWLRTRDQTRRAVSTG